MAEIETWGDVLALPEWSALNAEEQVRMRQVFVDNIGIPKLREAGFDDAKIAALREYQILNFDNGIGTVATFSKSLLKGITGMATSAVQGLGALTGIESIEQAGREAGAFMEREVITNPSSPIANTIGGGVGSAAAFLGTMGAGVAIGKGLGFAGQASMQTAGLAGGFLAGAGGGAQSADQLGMTGGDKYLRALTGGVTEVAVEKYLFGMGAEMNALRGGVRSLGRAIGTESVEEGVAQVGGNLADIGLAPEGAKTPGVFEDVGMSMLGGAAGGALFGGLTSRKPRTVSARAAAEASGDTGAAAVLAAAEDAATLLPVPMPELTPAPEGFLPEGALDAVSADPADLFLPEDLQELPPPPTEEQLAIYDAANPRRAALANPDTAGDPVQTARDLLRDLAAESQRKIPAVAAEAVADGTFNGDFRGPGSATLDIQDGNVVLRRYAMDRQHLTKEGQVSQGAQDLWDTSERNGGGAGVPTIGAARQTAGVSESSYPDYQTEGVFRIPVERFRELMAAGEILLGNVGETEVVISPAVAQQYLAEVTDRGDVQNGTPAPLPAEVATLPPNDAISVPEPVQTAPAEKVKLTPAAEEPFTEPDLQIEAPELAQIIETGRIALPPPEYFAARRKRDAKGTNTLSASEAAALRQWSAYEAIPAPSEVPRRARETYKRLFARTGGAAADVAAVGATYETEAAVDPSAAEAPEETLNRIGESLRRIGDETALTEEDYFAPQIEAEKQKQREMDAAFAQAVSQGNPVRVSDLGRTLKADDVIVLGDGTEAIVEEVEANGTLNLWSETYGSQRVKPAESIGVQSVQQSPLNLYTRSAPEWAASVARQMVPGSEVVMLGDNEFVEIDAEPFSLGDKPAPNTPRKQRMSMTGVRGARVRINGKPTVVLNRDQVTKDTPVHEVAHGLISMLPADIRSRGEALMNQHGRRYLGDIRRRYTRAGINLSEAGLMEEALVTLLGNEGVALWDKYVKSGRVRRLLMEWIAAVKTWFRDTFGYSPDITLEQWGRMQNERFLAQRRGRQRAQGGTGMSFAGARAETPQFMRDSLATAQAMAAAGTVSDPAARDAEYLAAVRARLQSARRALIDAEFQESQAARMRHHIERVTGSWGEGAQIAINAAQGGLQTGFIASTSGWRAVERRSNLAPSWDTTVRELDAIARKLPPEMTASSLDALDAELRERYPGTGRVAGLNLRGVIVGGRLLEKVTMPDGSVWNPFNHGDPPPSLELAVQAARSALIEAEAAAFLAEEEDAGRTQRLADKESAGEWARRTRAAEFAALLSARDTELRNAGSTFVTKVWQALAAHDEVFQFGRSPSKSANVIAKAVSAPGMPVTASATAESITFSGKTGSLTIFDADTPRPYIRSTSADSQGKERGGGAQMYAAALDWIHNNKKRITDDPRGLTDINAIRRTSNFLASAIRHGTTRHLHPHAKQRVRWGKDDMQNISALAAVEMDNAFRAVAEASYWTYGFTDGTFRDSSGDEITREGWQSAVRLGNPGQSGIGVATLQRAVITQSALQAFKRGEAAQSLLDVGESGVAPGSVLYSLAPTGTTAAARDAEYMAAVEAGDMETAQRMVDEAARAAGYNRKGVRAGFYVKGVPLPPSRDRRNFGPGYYVAENAELGSTSPESLSVSPELNARDLERLGVKPEDVEFRRDAVYVKAARPIRSEYGGNYDQATADFINAQLAYDSAVQDAYRRIGADFEETSWGKTVADLIAAGRLQFDSRQGATGRKGMTSELVVQHASQIKSADPVTRDESGNVIPLSQRFDTATPDIRFSLAPTGMASGPAGTTRLRAVFEAEYATENFKEAEAQVRGEFEKLSKRNAPFDEFMSTLRDMNDNTEGKWLNMSAPAFFGLMASDADARSRRAAGRFGEGKGSAEYRKAESELRRLEYYQGAVAAAMGQHVKGYHLAWTLTSPERQVAVMARLHLFDGSAAKLKNHDEAVAGIAQAAAEHAQAAAADIAPTDVAAQVERLVAADSAAAASDEIIDTATGETQAGITDLLEGVLDRASLEDRATANRFFEFLLIADVGAELDAQGESTQLSLSDTLASQRAAIKARMAQMTPAQRAVEVARAREGMKAIVAQRTSLTVRAAQPPDLIAEDPQALAVFKLQKSLELLINSGKKQSKGKTKTDAETVAAAIQAALLDKAGIATKLVPGVDMATTIGLLIANQDSARQVLDQVQSQLNSDPKTRGIISSGRLRAFGEAVIGRRFDTDDAAPYGPNQIAKLLRDEMKAAKLDVRKLIRSAALTRMNFSVLEEQLRAPERGLEARIGPEALNRLVTAVRAEYEKTLSQRKAEADKKRTAPKRPTTKTAPAVSPQAQQTLRAQMTESGAKQLLSALRSAMEQKPADGPLNAADKALNAELSRIIREAAAEATESKPTDPVDKLISQLGIPELRQERLDLLDQLVDEKIGTMEDPVQAAALRDAWVTASEELRTRNVSKSTAARMVSRSIKGKDRTGLREAVRSGNELAITAIGERAVAQAIGAVRERVSQDPGMQATTTDAQIDALAADFTAAFGDIVEAARLRESEKARIEFRKERIAQGLGVTLTAEEKTALLSQKPENLLDYVLKQFGFDYKTFASKFVTEAKGEAGFRAAVDRLAAQLGLDADQAELFARPLIERALKAMPEARAAALRETLKAKIDKVAGKVIKKARRKEDNERLVEAIELGALDEGTLDPVLQHITGVSDISPYMKTQMLTIVRRMQGDISPTQHSALRAELMHVIQGARGVPLGGLVGDIYMSHVFGGGNTMLKVNPVFGFVKLIFDSPALFFSAVRGASGLTKLSSAQKHQAIAAMVGSTRQAFTKEGMSMAVRMFRDGIGPAQDDQSIYGESTSLETLHNSPAAMIRLPGGKLLSARATRAIRKITLIHPYVRRIMAATDLIYRAPAHQILKAQQAVLAVRDEASGGGRPLPKSAAEWRARIDEVNYGRPFPQAVAEARATADAEVAAGTLDQKNYYQRTADLLDGMMADAYGLTTDYRPGMTGAERLAEIRERAKRATFANRTSGVLGGVGNVLKQAAATVPFLRTQLPAVNVPINALNQALDWTPWGFLRSWIGTKSSRGVATRTPTMSVSRYMMDSWAKVPSGWLAMDEVVNEETIAEMRFKAIAGTALMGAIITAFAQDFDKDEEDSYFYITAQGPEDKAEKKVWLDRGFKPNHIYFNGTGYNFYETPLSAMLISIGAWSDAHRYAPNDMDKADKAAFAMTRTVMSAFDASAMSGLSDLFSAVFGGSISNAHQKLNKITTRTAASFFGPNIVREINTFLYGKQDAKYQSWWGNALATVPFIYSIGFDSRPALNVFGEPLQEGSVQKGMSAVTPMIAHRLVTNVLDDPQMHFAARHGINTYVTRRRMLDGTEIEDDYNTMRAWVQNSGKRLRAELTPEYMQSIDTLAETDKERAEELFDAFVKRIRDAELDALPGVAPRGT
jgi:hypothetical protein